MHRSPALRWQTAFFYSQIFQLVTHQSRAPAAICLHPSSYVFVHSWVSWPCFHVGGFLAAALPWRPLLIRLFRTVDGWTWVPLVSASSELMALLDIFRFRREISLMYFSSAALSFLGRPLRLWSSTLPVSLCFFQRAWTAHLETPVCSELFVWERPCWCSRTPLCLVAVLSLSMV